ncbi:MAG TPA: hypothetical protein VIB39_21255 [Candidatus Angelobacter sp.]|jgi:hypothetical protein
MKPLRFNVAILALWSVLSILAGCTHKKPVLVAPQPLPPPTAAPQASPTPEPAAQADDKSQPAQDAQAPAPDQTKQETTQADKAKPPQKPSPRKPARKTVVDADKTEPAPAAGQVSPAPTTADASHAQGSTEQLLKSAEANLNGIKRQLSKEEEAKRSQALEFIRQSRAATSENDSARAYNLALKARLLSDELMQQR